MTCEYCATAGYVYLMSRDCCFARWIARLPKLAWRRRFLDGAPESLKAQVAQWYGRDRA